MLNSGCESAANKFMLHVMAAVAEHEAKAISERTKAALDAYKARGGLLGGQLPQCRNLTPDAMAKGRARAGQVIRQNATEAYADLLPMMTKLRKGGLTLDGIADRLNGEGHTTRRGKPWNPMQVSRVLRGCGRPILATVMAKL